MRLKDDTNVVRKVTCGLKYMELPAYRAEGCSGVEPVLRGG